ncbi:MAG: hypothetical protein J0L88_05985 [Xanthomonadales bacterium]|nr:hypothetical protein [Xanthomonadales bacterium]
MSRSLLAIALAVVAGHAVAAPGTVTLGADDLARLVRMPVGATTDLAAFPVGPGVLAAVRFERIDVYASDARIVEMTAGGERELPRSRHVQLLGHAGDGVTRLALSLDPDSGALFEGACSTASGAFVVRSRKSGTGYAFEAIDANAALPAGVVLDYADNVDSVPAPDAAPAILEHLAAQPVVAASTPATLAVVAVDTDNEFLLERFSNNSTQATDWIAALFAQLNIFYRSDLDMILLQGTTLLRPSTTADPFNNVDTPASNAQLVEFGNWWSANQGAVPRAFAMLLSGKASSPNSGSGIAWVNRYCATSGTGGSYSVNQVFTNTGIPASSSGFLVGHELGHNFGASHTHCSNATTGAYPTATSTIDQCYSGESGCWSGPTSCPASGPGAPAGTLMSYCHVSSAGCGQNVLQFHPTHVTQIRARIAANTTPSCLRSEVIFGNGFQ